MNPSTSENVSTPVLGQGPDSVVSPAGGRKEEVRVELQKVLAAGSLHDSDLLRRFLQYVVDYTLAGKADQLKEYRLGVDVFDRQDSFDPRLDPVVRMAARRLRQKLQEYYEQEGRAHPLRIEIPKGGYAAVFTAPPIAATSAAIPEPPAQARSHPSPPSASRPAWAVRVVWGMAIILAAAGIAYSIYRLRPRRAQATTGKIMLAVLPFANLSGNAQEDYFSDGITEEFIARLGNMNPQRLGVIARTSVMGYKNTSKHVDEIGRELGVQYILEGSVRRSGSRARITAQLIQVSDQTHLWSQSYDGDSHNLLELESRIAEAAAREVSVNLKQPGETLAPPAFAQPGLRVSQAGAAAIDPEAHELYLQGRYFWNKRSTADVFKSLDYFQSAVKKDPSYALAYAGIADAYGMLAANDQAPAEEVVPKARAAAQRALKLDGGLAEVHAALAHIKFFYDWDFAGAEAEYRRALELNSGSANAHHFFGVMLMWTGRLDEATEQLRQAQVLDPLSSVNSAALGLAYLFSGKDDLAMRQARKTLETAPNDAVPHALLGFCYERKQMYNEAMEELRRGVTLSNRDSEMLGWLGWVLARAGRRGEAESIIAELQAPAKPYAAAHDIAIIYVGLGDNERALHYLDQAVTRHEADALNIKMEFAWQPLRANPRFQALLRTSGLVS